MDSLEKISIASFVWYLVPGMSLLFLIFYPFIIIDPTLAKLVFNVVGAWGLVFLSIVFGFFLDGLRLYRFKHNYDSIKSEFFRDLRSAAELDTDPYLIISQINDIAKKNVITSLGMRHAIWIMHGHIAILSYIEAGLFFIIFVYSTNFFGSYLPNFTPSSYTIFGSAVDQYVFMLIMLLNTILFTLIAKRLEIISTEDQLTTNKMYIDLARQHRCSLVNVTPPE